MSRLPEVSVIVPTRNRSLFLQRCLTSVLAQEDVTLEVVVVDDASDDGTWEHLESTVDHRIQAVRHPEVRGVAEARNTGLASARSPWVAFLDDDDLWAPTKLKRQLDQLRSSPLALWACTGAAVVNEELVVDRLHAPPESDDLVKLLLSHNCVPGGGSGVVAGANLVRSVGGFDTALRNLADWDLWIRLALASPLAVVADPLVASVVHGNALSCNVASSFDELKLLRRKYARECAARGVTLGGWASGRYRAESYLRAGQPFKAAAVELRHGIRHGRARSFAWVAFALLSPMSLGRRDRERVERTADPALATANSWLVPFREGVLPVKDHAAHR